MEPTDLALQHVPYNGNPSVYWLLYFHTMSDKCGPGGRKGLLWFIVKCLIQDYDSFAVYSGAEIIHLTDLNLLAGDLALLC